MRRDSTSSGSRPGIALWPRLKELEFDHRTGTVSDEDYRAQVGPLRRDAAAALQALQRVEGAAEERQEEGETAPRAKLNA